MSIVQSLWIGPALPPLQQLSIRSFLAQGHEYHLYTYDHVANVPHGTTIRDGCAVLPRDSVFCYQHGFGKGSYAAFSNLFRYQLILDRGGWWVDTDLVCLKPFSFDDPLVFATERDSDGTMNCATCAFRCPAGVPLLEYCVGAVLAMDRQAVQWGQIGPQLFTAAIDRYQLTSHCVPVETFNPIDFVDFNSSAAAGFDIARLARSHGVHLWNQMWRSRELDPAAAALPDSLYAILSARYPCRPAVALDGAGATGA